ncbi:methionyl-tRNA formyltransferase [Desulfitobacterium sp.]|uniref:methionyl-tRNA formyltransferase n=1 Tax=Desulfitobacterium sp. TaxID=49981 RepID=UPI002BA1E410|nr:methionyl-tRNA formyltransferase [Desulfitobacterium sp.]HVJ50546.1 methionyl-tRNA formyltransferase [Desulfitobacterium sp.]
MRLVFMGTPEFAVPSLQALVAQGHEIGGVFTQPDRPAGRGKKLKPSAVKVAAQELGLLVFQPERIKTPEVLAQLRELAPEGIIVVAYGQILSADILKLPPQGCINVHASLLPKYRGAAPIHWAVMKGETQTGVTTMLMDEGLDTGDMLLKAVYPISEEATTGELDEVLAQQGAELLLKTLDQLAQGTLVPKPQTGETSYASLLKREHEKIDWTRSAQDIHNQIRGLNPYPGSYTTFLQENLKIWRSRLQPSDPSQTKTGERGGVPGEVVEVVNEGIILQTGSGQILVQIVQPAGKRAMPARDFFLGRRAQVGEVLGQ